MDLQIATPGKVVLPEDTHTVVAVTENHYGFATAEDFEDPTAERLLRSALSNMTAQGAKREWGYVVYAFGPGLSFRDVHWVDGSVIWEREDEVTAEPVIVGVRGSRSTF